MMSDESDSDDRCGVIHEGEIIYSPISFLSDRHLINGSLYRKIHISYLLHMTHNSKQVRIANISCNVHYLLKTNQPLFDLMLYNKWLSIDNVLWWQYDLSISFSFGLNRSHTLEPMFCRRAKLPRRRMSGCSCRDRVPFKLNFWVFESTPSLKQSYQVSSYVSNKGLYTVDIFLNKSCVTAAWVKQEKTHLEDNQFKYALMLWCIV